MKKIKLFAVVSLTALTFVSCKKESANAAEHPAQATINAKVVVNVLEKQMYIIASEFGNKITFTKEGKVTQLGALVVKKGNTKVSFWDSETKSLLASQVVNITDTAKFTYLDISPINVSSNKKYILSITGTSGYNYRSKNSINNNSIYPFISGSVIYSERLSGSAGLYPNSIINGATDIGGIADLTFVAN